MIIYQLIDFVFENVGLNSSAAGCDGVVDVERITADAAIISVETSRIRRGENDENRSERVESAAWRRWL